MLLPQDLLDKMDHYTVDTYAPVVGPGGEAVYVTHFKLCFKPWWKRDERIMISCIKTLLGEDQQTFEIAPEAVELAEQLREWALATVGVQEAMEQSQRLLSAIAARR